MMALKRTAFIAALPAWPIVYALVFALAMPYVFMVMTLGWIAVGDLEQAFERFGDPVGHLFFSHDMGRVGWAGERRVDNSKILAVRFHKWATVAPTPKPSIEDKINQLEAWHKEYGVTE